MPVYFLLFAPGNYPRNRDSFFFSDGALLIMNPVKVVILLVNRLEGEGLRDKIAHS